MLPTEGWGGFAIVGQIAGSHIEAIAGSWYPGTAIVDNTQVYEVIANAVANGVEHVILFVGDGMELGHEIAGNGGSSHSPPFQGG